MTIQFHQAYQKLRNLLELQLENEKEKKKRTMFLLYCRSIKFLILLNEHISILMYAMLNILKQEIACLGCSVTYFMDCLLNNVLFFIMPSCLGFFVTVSVGDYLVFLSSSTSFGSYVVVGVFLCLYMLKIHSSNVKGW